VILDIETFQPEICVPTHDCRGDTITLDSRHVSSLGARRRRRQCVKCGTRFTTLEIAAQRFHDLLRARESLLKIGALIQNEISPAALAGDRGAGRARRG